MKLFPPNTRRRECHAFSLAELMVSMAISLFFLAAVLSTHLCGLRLFELTKAKLGASDEARAAISKLVSEIRSAKIVRIGTGNLTDFTEIAPNAEQKGSAIQVYPTTNTTEFIRYYWDPSDQRLKRTINGSTYVWVVANSISNEMVFTSEDHAGNILNDNENNRVIGLSLQFFQLQYPVVPIGPGNYFDFYQLRTKITRRALE